MPGKKSPISVLRIRVELIDSKPKIWREILVSNSITFETLHQTIQNVMGWGNSHLYSFEAGSRRSPITIQCTRDPFGGKLDFSFVGGPDYEAEKTKILDFLSATGDKLIYEYDFGDSWQHQLTVKKVISPELFTEEIPACIGGEMMCPFEDCGGIYGFYRLQEILADTKNPEHEDMLEWCGGKIPDWKDFSVELANSKLSYLRNSGNSAKKRRSNL